MEWWAAVTVVAIPSQPALLMWPFVSSARPSMFWTSGLSRYSAQPTPCWLHLTDFGQETGCWCISCYSQPQSSPSLYVLGTTLTHAHAHTHTQTHNHTHSRYNRGDIFAWNSFICLDVGFFICRSCSMRVHFDQKRRCSCCCSFQVSELFDCFWNLYITQLFSRHNLSCILSQYEVRYPCAAERLVDASPFSLLLDTSPFESLFIHPCIML